MLVITTEQKINLNAVRNILTDKYMYVKILRYTTRKIQSQDRNGKNEWFIGSETFYNFESEGKFICIHPDGNGKTGIFTKGLGNQKNMVLVCDLADINEIKIHCIKNNVPVYMLCISSPKAEKIAEYSGLLDEINYLYELTGTDIDNTMLASEINFLYNDWCAHFVK